MDKKPEKLAVTLWALPKPERGWQADCGDHHGRGLTKLEALCNLGHAIEKAEWKARPDPKLCPTCSVYGSHEPGCKDDPNPKAIRKARRA